MSSRGVPARMLHFLLANKFRMFFWGGGWGCESFICLLHSVMFVCLFFLVVSSVIGKFENKIYKTKKKELSVFQIIQTILKDSEWTVNVHAN